MFESIANFFKKLVKSEEKQTPSKNTAKERLHLVLMQDRANVSADFLELMKQEIIEVIKKYVEVEESAIDVRLTNDVGEDGTQGAPSLYANIPILNIKNDMKKTAKKASEGKQEEKTAEEVKTSEVKAAEEVKTSEVKADEKEKVENEEKTDAVEEKKNVESEFLEEKEDVKDEQEEIKEEKIDDEKSSEEEKVDESNEDNTGDKEEK